METLVVLAPQRSDGAQQFILKRTVLAILSPQQISDLSTLIVENFGAGLSSNDLADCIGMCLEDIAGMETASSDELRQIYSLISGAYYDSIRQKQ